MPGITFEDTALQGNESLKGFDSPDALGKAYVELHGRVQAGDMSLIPEDIRKDPSMSSFKTVADVAKSFIETKKLVGSIKKAPETPDGYKFTALQNLNAGLKNVPETQKVMAAMFHKHGIHNEAADGIQQDFLTLLSNALTKQDEARKAKNLEVETALRADWKADYDKNVQTVQNVLKRAGAADLAESIKTNPAALKAMAKITALLSEDSIGKLDGGGGSENITEKSAAEKRIQEMISEQWHMKKDDKGRWIPKTGAEYDKARAEWDRLHKILAGEATT